jgi:hypothetical protein
LVSISKKSNEHEHSKLFNLVYLDKHILQRSSTWPVGEDKWRSNFGVVFLQGGSKGLEPFFFLDPMLDPIRKVSQGRAVFFFWGPLITYVCISSLSSWRISDRE